MFLRSATDTLRFRSPFLHRARIMRAQVQRILTRNFVSTFANISMTLGVNFCPSPTKIRSLASSPAIRAWKPSCCVCVGLLFLCACCNPIGSPKGESTPPRAPAPGPSLCPFALPEPVPVQVDAGDKGLEPDSGNATEWMIVDGWNRL